METVAEKTADRLDQLKISEAAAFKVDTKEHKSFKQLEHAYMNAALSNKLAVNEKKFYSEAADHQATRLDSAKEILDEKKEVYQHYNDELQKVNAGGVIELGY